MIISASRRTDIPACYPDWFMNRVKAGEVLVPNPYNRKKVSRIPLSPDTVDCIAFWTKNPEPMLPRLRELDSMGYRYYFQMTVTDYGREMEEKLPDTEDSLATFMLLSDRLGKERVDWRFDPIIIDGNYTLTYHAERFEMMCQWLHNYTTRCIISFVDAYKNSMFLESEPEEIENIAKELGSIARKYNLPIYTCAEGIDLNRFGIQHGSCMDKKKIQEIIGYKLDIRRAAGQRKECRCMDSIDIGMYDTCINGCKYCYANGGLASASKKYELHNPESPLLIGNLQGDETIIDKAVRSNQDMQLSLFDSF